MSRLTHDYYYDPDKTKADVDAMRQRVLDCVADLKADQQPLAKARREKQLLESMARAEAGVALANEIITRILHPKREAA